MVTDNLLVFEIDRKLQEYFYENIYKIKIFPLISFYEKWNMNYHCIIGQDTNFGISGELKKQVKILKSNKDFWEIVRKYESMEIDESKYISFSEVYLNEHEYMDSEDIACIISYYLINFLENIKEHSCVDALEYYQKLDKWKKITLIRCPVLGRNNDYLLYSNIVNVELSMLEVIKRYQDISSVDDFQIVGELDRLKNECLLHYRISREKLVLLYIIRYCNDNSLIEKLFVNENDMRRICNVQGEMADRIKRKGIEFVGLEYNDWIQSELFIFDMIISNPIFKYWSNLINEQILIKSLFNGADTENNHILLGRLYDHFSWQISKSKDALEKNLELINQLSNN